MLHITPTLRASSPSGNPSKSGGDRRKVINPYGSAHAAKAARAAVHMAFGRHAWALDQGNFIDRKPWMLSLRSSDKI